MATSTTDGLTLAERTFATAFPEPPSGVTTPRLALSQTVEKAIVQDDATPDVAAWADTADWGLTLGIAIAIARSEDPFEPLGRVVERALPAAAEAYHRFAGVDVLTDEEVA
jgi:hypothetical protein